MHRQIIDKVRGTSFYDVPWDSLSPGTELTAKREPDNPYDNNAISLWLERKMIGHIKKEIAADLAPLLDEGDVSIKVIVLEVTGGEQIPLFAGITDKKHNGCNIQIELTYSQKLLDSMIEE